MGENTTQLLMFTMGSRFMHDKRVTFPSKIIEENLAKQNNEGAHSDIHL